MQNSSSGLESFLPDSIYAIFVWFHACWGATLIQFLEAHYPTINSYLGDDLLVAASDETSKEFRAVETLLMGNEVPMPP